MSLIIDDFTTYVSNTYYLATYYFKVAHLINENPENDFVIVKTYNDNMEFRNVLLNLEKNGIPFIARRRQGNVLYPFAVFPAVVETNLILKSLDELVLCNMDNREIIKSLNDYANIYCKDEYNLFKVMKSI